ncbi:MAG: 2-oxoacid:acceptor oxidoreductase family protein [Thermodesulfobacteriota bacterium]|nr:2-oxoacid:acceptor oxidoreductase family protein [Thermodesulfobacteriota bacterium]
MAAKSQYQEIIITGFGGQGIILSGNILGKAATLFEKKNATLIQSYGPEARGGACAAQVVVSTEAIEYPYIEKPHIIICMSQEGFDIYAPRLVEGGKLFTDSGLVKIDPDRVPKDVKTHSIPATEFAEEMGVKMMANIIMLSFAISATDLVSYDSLRQTIEISVPKGTEKKNLAGMEKGFQYGLDLKEEGK